MKNLLIDIFEKIKEIGSSLKDLFLSNLSWFLHFLVLSFELLWLFVPVVANFGEFVGTWFFEAVRGIGKTVGFMWNNLSKLAGVVWSKVILKLSSLTMEFFALLVESWKNSKDYVFEATKNQKLVFADKERDIIKRRNTKARETKDKLKEAKQGWVKRLEKTKGIQFLLNTFGTAKSNLRYKN